ncbi:ubiquitin-conjugating enzyme E2 A isoform X2 [Halyomorpha halys]|uniref:ubiquitin-conjugating enzyme E2 A isoform X2 n=1 Tax=Halyomorpha halys TaxID=286706 RepID=UPI0034D175EC
MLKTGSTAQGTAIKRLMADQIKPEGSYYEGGKFYITLYFPKDYPQKPPEVKFTSHIFHPNIFFNGEICLEELEEDWDPNYDVLSILLLVQHLLREPNFSSPANPKASKLFRKNEEEYKDVVKACIEKNKEDEDEIQNKKQTIGYY